MKEEEEEEEGGRTKEELRKEGRKDKSFKSHIRKGGEKGPES